MTQEIISDRINQYLVIGLKRCKSCNQDLAVDKFELYRNKYYSSDCVDCLKLYHQKYYSQKKEYKVCECGKTVNAFSLNSHIKTRVHNELIRLKNIQPRIPGS